MKKILFVLLAVSMLYVVTVESKNFKAPPKNKAECLKRCPDSFTEIIKCNKKYPKSEISIPGGNPQRNACYKRVKREREACVTNCENRKYPTRADARRRGLNSKSSKTKIYEKRRNGIERDKKTFR